MPPLDLLPYARGGGAGVPRNPRLPDPQPEWRQAFVGKTLTDAFKLDQDIPNIAGATLSCKNVTNGVKRLLALQQVALSRGR